VCKCPAAHAIRNALGVLCGGCAECGRVLMVCGTVCHDRSHECAAGECVAAYLQPVRQREQPAPAGAQPRMPLSARLVVSGGRLRPVLQRSKRRSGSGRRSSATKPRPAVTPPLQPSDPLPLLPSPPTPLFPHLHSTHPSHMPIFVRGWGVWDFPTNNHTAWWPDFPHYHHQH
jgi:hypothetical protein